MTAPVHSSAADVTRSGASDGGLQSDRTAHRIACVGEPLPGRVVVGQREYGCGQLRNIETVPPPPGFGRALAGPRPRRGRAGKGVRRTAPRGRRPMYSEEPEQHQARAPWAAEVGADYAWSG